MVLPLTLSPFHHRLRLQALLVVVKSIVNYHHPDPVDLGSVSIQAPGELLPHLQMLQVLILRSSAGSVPGFKDIDRKVSLTDGIANKSKDK
jgi:hypothetical protein